MTFIINVLAPFLLSFVLGCFIIPKISLIAFKKRLFDRTGGRKIHSGIVPRLGGVAFFPCIFLSTVLVVMWHYYASPDELPDGYLIFRLLACSACLVIFYMMGMMDDLIGVRYRSKFMIQILCGLLLTFAGLRFNYLYGLFGLYALPGWMQWMLTVFMVVFILNAFNLIDGIDGLAAGLGCMAFVTGGIVCMFSGLWLDASMAFAAFGVLVPFFYYNVFGNINRGRKIFMGDTGSLTIGLLVSILTVRLCMYSEEKELHRQTVQAVGMVSILIVPLFDVVRVVSHRLRNGKSPFLPDKNHIHHKLMDLGLSHFYILLTLFSLTVVFYLLNLGLVTFLPVTWVFVADVAIWTFIQLRLTYTLQKRIVAPN